jgi:hypothetical protein
MTSLPCSIVRAVLPVVAAGFVMSMAGCSSSDDATTATGTGGAGAAAGTGGGTSAATGGSAGSGTAGTGTAGTAGGSAGKGGGSGAGNAGSGGAAGGGGGSGGTSAGGAAQGGQGGGSAGAAGSADFWGDTTSIPAAKNVLTIKFLNKTNGQFVDADVYWRFDNGPIHELHAIADMPTYDMPANSSGRMYFYLCTAGDAACKADPTKSKYFDFIEHTIGADQYNGNTTRVDAFGLKIAIRLHCADGFDKAVGEDQATFAETREATFAKYLADVPPEFAATAQPPFAPYRIVAPGAAGFGKNGAHATYYDSFVDQLWAANGITIAKPGPDTAGLAMYPDLSAAINRHVGAVAGSFDATGKLLDKNLWKDATTFYQQAPANYYAAFWHKHAIDGKAYGFPYDDVGGYSTYVSHKMPQYLLVAIGY